MDNKETIEFPGILDKLFRGILSGGVIGLIIAILLGVLTKLLEGNMEKIFVLAPWIIGFAVLTTVIFELLNYSDELKAYIDAKNNQPKTRERKTK